MKLTKHNQLNLFPQGSHVIFSDKPCILCQSNFHVINTLVKLPGEHYSKFAMLCETCRNKPWFFKE